MNAPLATVDHRPCIESVVNWAVLARADRRVRCAHTTSNEVRLRSHPPSTRDRRARGMSSRRSSGGSCEMTVSVLQSGQRKDSPQMTLDGMCCREPLSTSCRQSALKVVVIVGGAFSNCNARNEGSARRTSSQHFQRDRWHEVMNRRFSEDLRVAPPFITDTRALRRSSEPAGCSMVSIRILDLNQPCWQIFALFTALS